MKLLFIHFSSRGFILAAPYLCCGAVCVSEWYFDALQGAQGKKEVGI